MFRLSKKDLVMTYVILVIAVVFEIIATTLLKKTEQFTQIVPTIAMVVCYLVAFFCMTIVMKTIPVGIVYATWSGLGIVLVSLAAYFVYQQTLDTPAIIGLTLIVAGVLVMNLLSKSTAH